MSRPSFNPLLKNKGKLKEIITSFDKDPYSPFDSSKDVSNISVESSFFDSSKYSYHLLSSYQEVIASTKGERSLELGNEPFFVKKKPFSAHLPFKKKFVFFEKRSVSTSSPIWLFEDDSELRDIQSSAIVGIICEQSHWFNVSKNLLRVLTRNNNVTQNFP